MAQNDMAPWYFGNLAGLSFTSSPPGIVLNSAMNANAGSSSVADASGNLLFYTDGQTVWNKTNAIMANGTGLNNNISWSGTMLPLIIKQPGNSNIYFIITYTAGIGSANSLCYSTVDMSLAAGLGSVTAQNVAFASGIYRYAVTATRHCNGRDAWIIAQLQQGFNCQFHAFAVTASGISVAPVVSPALPTGGAIGSEMIVSPNGKKLGMLDNAWPSLADFDNSTGIVTNHFVLAGAWYWACFAMAFSPDGSKLYTTNGNVPRYLLQWNVCAGSDSAVYASRDSMALVTLNPQDMKLAIDGKIYVISYNATSLDVINAPNQSISLINYVNGGQSIAPNSGTGALPRHENGFVHAPPQTPPFTYTVSNSYGCQTASFTAMPVIPNYTTIGCSVVGYSLTNFVWNFGDPNSGAANTSTLASTSHFFSSLGNYTVQLILYYSCGGANDTLSQVVQVNQPCINVNSTGISCASLGSATVSALIGTGPFSYTWLPTAQTGSTATGLAPGMYTVLVQDGFNTTYTATTTFTSPVSLSSTVSASSSVSCYGATNGTASIVTAGGSGNAYYLWTNGVTSFTTSSITGIAAGSWSVTVTDALTNCVADSVFTIATPPPLNITITPGTASICLGSGLLLTGSISPGTAGIVYQWQPTVSLSAGNTITVTASPTVTTIYTLTATLNGCSNSVSDTVYVVSPPSLNIALSSATTCAEAFNGSANTITLTAGGANTYTISTPNDIYNSNPSGPATNLNTLPPHIAGLSTATVFGSNGVCTVSTTAIFSIVPNPTVSISSPTPVICAGQSFTYTSAGASSYTWSSATPGQTLITSGNIAVSNATTNAVYSVYGGSLGCNSPTQSTTITVNPLPVVNIYPSPVTTCSGSPVPLQASGTGTLYNWAPQQWLSGSGGTVYANPPTQQDYTVVASLNNCSTSAVVTVSVLPLPVPFITTTTPSVCVHSNIALHGKGGVDYFWTGPGGNLQGQDVSFEAFSASYSGMYTLTVRDQNNCEASTTQSITVRALPEGYFNAAGLQGCAPFYASMIFQPIPGTASITSQTWQVNNSNFNSSNFNYLFSNAGNYVVRGQLTDAYNCANTLTAMVSVHPRPQADFSFLPEHPVEGFDEVQFSNQSIGATAFNWEFMNTQNTSTVKDPVFLFENAGTYPVALVVQNQWACKDTVVKIVNVGGDFSIYVPNAFTPNNDGKNELFRPVMRNMQSQSFSVFDRWGEKLFETADAAGGWDGSYKGAPCQQGIYVWKLKVQLPVNESNGQQARELVGQVLLYR